MIKCIFAEKFDVAIKIAVSLSVFKDNNKLITMSNLEKHKENMQKKYKPKGFIEIDYNGKTYVTWGQGHLVRLKNVNEYGEEFKNWKDIPLPFIPNYSLSPIDSKFAKEQLKVIRDIFSKSDLIINATDFDREGDLIFTYIYEYLRCNKPYKRVKLDSQTEEGFKKAFSKFIDNNLVKNIENAGRSRSIADWLIGINLTVSKTLIEKDLFSIGRVQTPTLNMIVERELEILNFKEEDYYVIESLIKIGDKEFNSKYKGEFKVKNDATDKAKNLAGEGQVKSVKKAISSIQPPKLFNLTELSIFTNEKLGLSAKETLDIAQGLYEKGYITYPRTSSVCLTEDMKDLVDDLLNLLSPVLPNIKKCTNRNFTSRYYDNKKVDSHYAIIPTNNIPNFSNLTNIEEKVYKIIATRLASSVFDDAKVSKTLVEIDVNGDTLYSKGAIVLEKGFLEMGEVSLKEDILPDIKKGDSVTSNPNVLKKKTTAPKRYTDKTLLIKMKNAGKKADEDSEYVTKSGIGTEATRANIIESLLDKGYVEKKKKYFYPTEKGKYLIQSLNIEELKSPILTAKWENDLNLIENGDLNYTDFVKNIESEVDKWIMKLNKSVEGLGYKKFKHKFEVCENTVKYEKKVHKDTKRKCPICKNYISETEKAFCCNNCKIFIAKKIKDIDLSFNDIMNLIKGNEIGPFVLNKQKGTKVKLKYNIFKRTLDFNFKFHDSNNKS